jgi:hypothetical protein
MLHIPNSKTATFWAPKFPKVLLKQVQTTKNTLLQQTLKNLLRIAHKKSNKIAVFKTFKNFMARDKHQ